MAKPTPPKPAKPEPVAEPVETVQAPAPATDAPPTPVVAPSAMSAQLPMNVSAAPEIRGEPSYPSRARRRRIEGYVLVEFVVDANGNIVTDSYKVLESKPKKVFDKVVRRAVLRWRYAPTGSAFRTQQRFKFSMQN
ncbi:energy transducer TonB [Aliamphritea spongicola]|nr:energy transducer TonB [Aliamphritea spongicola]